MPLHSDTFSHWFPISSTTLYLKQSGEVLTQFAANIDVKCQPQTNELTIWFSTTALLISTYNICFWWTKSYTSMETKSYTSLEDQKSAVFWGEYLPSMNWCGTFPALLLQFLQEFGWYLRTQVLLDLYSKNSAYTRVWRGYPPTYMEKFVTLAQVFHKNTNAGRKLFDLVDFSGGKWESLRNK